MYVIYVIIWLVYSLMYTLYGMRLAMSTFTGKSQSKSFYNKKNAALAATPLIKMSTCQNLDSLGLEHTSTQRTGLERGRKIQVHQCTINGQVSIILFHYQTSVRIPVQISHRIHYKMWHKKASSKVS